MPVTVPYNKSIEYNELQFSPEEQASTTSGERLSNYRYEGFATYFTSVPQSYTPTVVIPQIQLYPSNPYNISAISIKTSISLNNKARTFFVYAIRKGTQLTTHHELLDIGTDTFYTLSQFPYITYSVPNNSLGYQLPLNNSTGGNRFYVQGFYKLYQSVEL